MRTKELINNNKREVKDVFYLIALQGLNYVAPLIVYPYLMVTLGAEKFGYIGFSMSFCTYLMLIVDFGFNLTATKRVALYKDNKSKLNEIFSATIYAKILLLAISFLILVLFSFIPQFKVYVTTMFVVFLMVVGNAFSFVWLFQGLGNIRLVSIVNTICKLSIFPITFFIVKYPNDYLLAAIVLSSVYIVSSIINAIIIWHKKWVSLIRCKIVSVKQEIKESYHIFLSNAATSIYTASFVVILGYFASPDEVGKYAAVDKLMRAMSLLVLMPVTQSFYPKVSRLGKQDKLGAIHLSDKLLWLVIVGMLCIAGGMFFFSDTIVELLGSDYADAELLFKIMAFVPLFIGIGGVNGQLKIVAVGNSENLITFKRIYIAAAAFALVLVFILVPKFDSVGAAVALLLTEFLVAVGMSIWSRNKILCSWK